MDNVKNMRKEALSDSIANQILKYINSIGLQKGDKLPSELQLCDMFSVGRSTIREAVKNLCVRRVLEIRRGSGTYVVSNKPIERDPLNLSIIDDKYQLAMDLVEVRILIEPKIAYLAALNGYDEEKSEILRLCDNVEEKINKGEEYTDLDVAFHSSIAKASHNIVVKELIPIIDTAVITFVNVTQMQLLSETILTHRMIAESIITGDAEGALGAMQMHLNFNRNLIARMAREAKK